MKKEKKRLSLIKSKIKAVFGWVRSAIKKISEIMIKIVILAAFIIFFVVPFLHCCIDRTLAQWSWYPAVVVSIFSFIISNVRSKNPIFKTPIFEFLSKWGEYSVYPIVTSIFVLNYYEIDYIWMWIIFGIVALYVPTFFLSLLSFQIKNNCYSEEVKKKMSLNIVKSIVLFLFLDLLYMSIFNSWIVSTFVFGILSIVIIFFNLTDIFLNGAKNLRFFIVLEMIVALILSAYLIFIIPNDSLQEIVLTIVAALFGGILTLIGVAWTIKRQDEINREQEKKKYRPIVLVHMSIPPETQVFEIETFDCETITFNPNENNKIETYIQTIFLKNTDFSHFYLLGLIVNGEKVLAGTKRYISKNDDFALSFSQRSIYLQTSINEIALYVQDLLGNYYKIPFSYEVIDSKILEQTYERIPKPQKDLKYEISQIHIIDEKTAIEIKE